MKKKTYMRHIWNLLDEVSEKIENIELKIDLLKSDDIEYNAQKLRDLIADTDDNKKEIMDIKSMISNLSNQIAAKEEPKETPKAETPAAEEKKEEVKETPVKEEPEQKPEEKKAPAKKAPAKKSTTKKAPAKK